MSEIPEFKEFPKIARISRDCIITEKIDGTNAQVVIQDGQVTAVGSRKRYLVQGSKQTDNFGFAAWVEQHKVELSSLGDGTHYGEWWGLGIQRGYNLFERRFSLFRTPKDLVALPSCVSVVPKLYEGPFSTAMIDCIMQELENSGSKAAPGFMKPEGVVIFHKGSGTLFKKTFENDEAGKGESHE
jgi:hypothetical protein